LVEHRTGIEGSNPVEALIFLRLLLSSCLSWKILRRSIFIFIYIFSSTFIKNGTVKFFLISNFDKQDKIKQFFDTLIVA